MQALLEQTADDLERFQRALPESERERRGNAQQMVGLDASLTRRSEHLGSKQADSVNWREPGANCAAAARHSPATPAALA